MEQNMISAMENVPRRGCARGRARSRSCAQAQSHGRGHGHARTRSAPSAALFRRDKPLQAPAWNKPHCRLPGWGVGGRKRRPLRLPNRPLHGAFRSRSRCCRPFAPGTSHGRGRRRRPWYARCPCSRSPHARDGGRVRSRSPCGYAHVRSHSSCAPGASSYSPFLCFDIMETSCTASA